MIKINIWLLYVFCKMIILFVDIGIEGLNVILLGLY